MAEIHIDRTDEEREELVKQWISNYWLAIVGAVLLAIGGVYGLDYLKQSKRKALERAAVEVSAVEQALTENRLDEALTKTTALQNNEKETTFSVIATLALAKKYFDDKAYDKAIEQYDWLIVHAGDMAVRDVARLRKSRAEADIDKYTQALTTLSMLEGSVNGLEANLLKGDILLADQQYEAAKKAYASIRAEEAINNQLIQQRLDLIDIKQQVVQ